MSGRIQILRGMSLRYHSGTSSSLIQGAYISGAGYQFGAQIVEKFLHVNKMVHILRAHQLCNEGYQVLFNGRLSTVWSAPNYCYRCGNRASICEVGDNGAMSFNVFDESPENQLVIKEQSQQNKV